MRNPDSLTSKRVFLLMIGMILARLHAAEPTAETLKTCPNGHQTLKNVMIKYGLMSGSELESKRMQKAIKDLEFALGGCAYNKDSPKHRVVCTTCRFSHSVASTAKPEFGTWTLISTNFANFPRPFSELVGRFPIPSEKFLDGPAVFRMCLTDNKQLIYDGVSFITTRRFQELTSDVTKHLGDQSVDASCDISVSKGDKNEKVEIAEWYSFDPDLRISLSRFTKSKTSKINMEVRQPNRNNKQYN